MSHTKVVCTIGPVTCEYQQLLELAKNGMNVARLNMSHGDHAWHEKVIKGVKSINEKSEFSVAILLDTKGPEVRSGDLKDSIELQKGDTFTFTVSHEATTDKNRTEVNYDGFVDDVQVGDVVLVDSGIINLEVVEKTATDVVCVCLDGGTITSRRHLNIKGKSANLPSITKKDWADIKFGVEQGVDFFALSFVKDGSAIKDLKKYLTEQEASVEVIAKIESAAAIPNIPEIITESDGAMVARGDLGAEIAIADVPLVQGDIIRECHNQGKPVIVATHMLESMILHPTPTRAEVTDITYAVMQGTDALMLSGETAAGKYPLKSLQTMRSVASSIEARLMSEKPSFPESTDDSKHEIAKSASAIASHIHAKAIVVITRRGYMASLVSKFRPHSPIHAFTNMSAARRKLNIFWGITSYRIQFSSDPEKTIQRALQVLIDKNEAVNGDKVIVVSDILAGDQLVETIQVRTI